MMSDVCKHCVNAPCLEVCPTGAILRTEFDTVYIQEPACNGCRDCIAACPFGVIHMSETQAHRPEVHLLLRPAQTACRRPAPRPARRSRSSSARSTSCSRQAQARVEQLHRAGRDRRPASTAPTTRSSAG